MNKIFAALCTEWTERKCVIICVMKPHILLIKRHWPRQLSCNELAWFGTLLHFIANYSTDLFWIYRNKRIHLRISNEFPHKSHSNCILSTHNAIWKKIHAIRKRVELPYSITTTMKIHVMHKIGKHFEI